MIVVVDIVVSRYGRVPVEGVVCVVNKCGLLNVVKEVDVVVAVVVVFVVVVALVVDKVVSL